MEDVEELPEYLKCKDCGRGLPSLYMLEKGLWAQASGTDHDRNICIWCIEKRIGRPLTIDDFDRHVWVNELIFFAHKMATGEDLFEPAGDETYERYHNEDGHNQVPE